MEHFFGEYQAFLQQVKPLSEEEILFLLLSRYAASSGASVYTEIRHGNDTHVFDSNVSEPLVRKKNPCLIRAYLFQYTDSVEEHLVNGCGVVHSEISLGTPQEALVPLRTPPLDVPLHDRHVSIQTTHGVEFTGSVTLNFPTIHANDRPHGKITSHSPTPQAYDTQQHTTTSRINLAIDWAQIPEELQPPAFYIHRCHHRGIEQVDEGMELPFGFPELVQHFHHTPSNVCLHRDVTFQN